MDKRVPLLQDSDACGIGAVVNIDGKATRSSVDDALKIVEKLEHRAGKDATGLTGDGVGILTQVPHKYFCRVMSGVELGGERDYGVGMIFFPQDKYIKSQAMKRLETLCEKFGLQFLSWREVPINPQVLGERARQCMPQIWQCFIKRSEGVAKGLDFDRKLYLLRRQFEKTQLDTYVVSFSSRTIVYKGMFLVKQLREFYLDLQAADYESAASLVHSRFSTNTTPSWRRAHPYRFIAHNGEINTIRGNADRMLAREETMKSTVFTDGQMQQSLPAIDDTGSDSAMLDNTLEFLAMNGIDLPKAVLMCIPEPWAHDEGADQKKRDFYHYWATMMEEWDGPAAVLFCDGDKFGATLDRNGLRPSRYYITEDGRLILSSEVGVLDIDESLIKEKSRLSPGKMLLVDLEKGKLISDEECKSYYANEHPYGEWLSMNLVHLKDLKIPNKKIATFTQDERDKMYRAFGWNYEDVNDVILAMAKNGAEPIGSMGVDTPLAFESTCHPALSEYFKQLFAQVTNPPIDSLREKIVTDTSVYCGSDGNILDARDTSCTVLQINNPILTGTDMIKIKALHQKGLNCAVVPILYYKNTSLEKALDNLFVAVENEYHKGNNIIVLSDRGVDESLVAIPSLLAVSAIEQYLIRTKKRTAISIILESAEVRSVHQAALILSYGARALNPYLAHECIAELIDQKLLDKDYHQAIEDFNKAILDGIVKIAAKMGISTIQSYQSAQIFEAVGLSRPLIDKYFTNTVSRIGGIGLSEIEEDVNYHHNKAFDPLGLAVNTHLDSVGVHKLRRGPTGEDHLYSPEVIIALQEATRAGDYKRFKEYEAIVDDVKKPHTIRALLDFDYSDGKNAIDINEVESVESIVKHFKTGAMSYGSISREAHECMALAMNHLGGKSNSGEGGEESERLGTDRNSAIKQVASGRFGVTEAYLLSAKEIQIKMAQGAKPGEGGHLPGKKVHPWIAKTRYSTPGVALISPPPHHDIYSIEDLAQLIYDLKNANRNARISVKLVSEVGVGTIACGVAKAGSTVILISGHDGGTGAAPLSSIHGAGLPWELGVAETQRALVENGLRSRVVIETDGKLMSSRDVAIACLLGAEEFGFATAPLVTMGCCMMRACQKDTCPEGIATQNEALRKCFKGKSEYVENFMKFIATGLRGIMAALGFKTIADMAGHTECLKVKKDNPFPRAPLIDMSAILGRDAKTSKEATVTKSEGATVASTLQQKTHFDALDAYDFHLERTIDESVFLPKFEAMKAEGRGEFCVNVSSTDRALGTILGSVIESTYHSQIADDSFVVKATGGAGQSFGAFIPKGLTMRLVGDANDYAGKGLSGGKIIVTPSERAHYNKSTAVITGNVALYGATSGKAYFYGTAGERFCVRNSGAIAVSEGCGDHGAEYMTGGTLVVLGKVGKNFAAGMSGGVAYVYDESHSLYKNLNTALVSMTGVSTEGDKEALRAILSDYEKETGSLTARNILDNYEKCLGDFKKVIGKEYEAVLLAQKEE